MWQPERRHDAAAWKDTRKLWAPYGWTFPAVNGLGAGIKPGPRHFFQ